MHFSTANRNGADVVVYIGRHCVWVCKQDFEGKWLHIISDSIWNFRVCETTETTVTTKISSEKIIYSIF